MRERRLQEVRELEGIIRQLQKRLKAAIKENNRLRKELNKNLITVNEYEDENVDYSAQEVKPTFVCESCGNNKSTVIDLGSLSKKRMVFEVCQKCKHRKKI